MGVRNGKVSRMDWDPMKNQVGTSGMKARIRRAFQEGHMVYRKLSPAVVPTLRLCSGECRQDDIKSAAGRKVKIGTELCQWGPVQSLPQGLFPPGPVKLTFPKGMKSASYKKWGWDNQTWCVVGGKKPQAIPC